MKKIFAGVILPLLIISASCFVSCNSSTTNKQQKKAEKEQVKEIQGQIESFRLDTLSVYRIRLRILKNISAVQQELLILEYLELI
jgi:hypothetical protein